MQHGSGATLVFLCSVMAAAMIAEENRCWKNRRRNGRAKCWKEHHRRAIKVLWHRVCYPLQHEAQVQEVSSCVRVPGVPVELAGEENPQVEIALRVETKKSDKGIKANTKLELKNSSGVFWLRPEMIGSLMRDDTQLIGLCLPSIL